MKPALIVVAAVVALFAGRRSLVPAERDVSDVSLQDWSGR